MLGNPVLVETCRVLMAWDQSKGERIIWMEPHSRTVIPLGRSDLRTANRSMPGFRCQAILFDLDGVLIDAELIYQRHWKNR